MRPADAGSGYCEICERVMSVEVGMVFHDTIMDREMVVVEVVDRGYWQKPWYRIAPAVTPSDYHTEDFDSFFGRFVSGRFVRKESQ
jgi:hypothetical protein